MARINSLTGSHIKAKHWIVRLLEVIPGAATWLTIILPVILAIYAPVVVAYFIIAYDLYWLMKSFRMSSALLVGHRRLRINSELDWQARLDRLETATEEGEVDRFERELQRERASLGWKWLLSRKGRRAHEIYHQKTLELEKLRQYETYLDPVKPTDVIHVVILATYNETLDTLRPSIRALAGVKYDPKKIWFVIAYEERGGERDEERVKLLQKEFSGIFAKFLIIKHPDGIAGEVRGKGANITFAGRKVLEQIREEKVNVKDVIVTTLDADHRPDPAYFQHITYAFVTSAAPKYEAYQPIPMFFNNIWDVPAPMRVLATGNSFWVIINSVRPHLLRNFAAHAQPLEALIETDFWSVNTIVEDGHQFWRSFFRFNGKYRVEPIYAPIYQDATLANGYFRTYQNQYLQLQRWAYGVSDFPYVSIESARHPKIPFGQRYINLWRLFEGHFSWATTPFILTFVAWLPLYLNPTFKYSVLAHQLPIIASQIMTIALLGLFITIWLSILSLPQRPKHAKKIKNVTMILQWVLLPVVALSFGAVAAIDAQTRLMLGKYLGFRVTEKATKQSE